MKILYAVQKTVRKNILSREGFTLLEIIISVGLSAFLLLIVYTTYFGINRSIEIATREQEVIRTGRMMAEMIKQDLGRAVFSEKYPFKGIVNEIGGGETTTFIEFATLSPINELQPKLYKVAYSLMAEENGERSMVRFVSRDLKADLLMNGVSYVITRSITSFNIEFYDGNDWLLVWDSGKDGKVPQQIRLTIEAKDSKGNINTVSLEEGLFGGK